ncbi:MAG: flagellar biosynthesis protein FlhA [Deltaproteobacteria bacterium]|nr:flagellar biosynthesis protein FlhA [Deltaproteobacteria bacterium]
MNQAATTVPVQSSRGGYSVPILLIGILFMMMMPVPPFLIDMALTLSIGFSLVMFLASVYIETPLSLSVFPTLLLISTLARLSMNVASTRLILLRGDEGPSAAGQVIRTFGEFVVGGNYVVGIIVFLILVIINFVVITKGAGRIAEVGARFILDAMPGKQMAIDADLSSGLIGEADARARRKVIQEEADFFGAMDGASKFVRGDAIAGLLITGINIVAGFIIGITQHDLTAADSASTYTILTVGDGLVSQIPALLISTSAGLVVTRSTSGEDLAPAISRQLLSRRHAMSIAGGVLGCMAFVPGMPAIPFLLLGGSMFVIARRSVDTTTAPLEPVLDTEEPITEQERLAALLPVDLLELEVGYELVPLVDTVQGGELTERIAGLRRNLVAELGIILPPIHVRDNLRLKPRQYRFLLSSNEVGSGEVAPAKLMAIDPGGGGGNIVGERTTEPAFGLPAWWITKDERANAETEGYTVVDPSTVMVTHITELVRNHADELLGRGEAQDLFDILGRSHPRLVDELIPAGLPATEVVRVLRQLLKEGVSIRDLRTIFEVLAEYVPRTKDPDHLVEFVRHRLARQITEKFSGEDNRVSGLILDTTFENEIRQSNSGTASQILGIDPRLGRRLLENVEQLAVEFSRSTAPPLLITSPDVRRAVSDFIRPRVPGLSVVSYAEVTQGTEIAPLGVAGLPEAKK